MRDREPALIKPPNDAVVIALCIVLGFLMLFALGAQILIPAAAIETANSVYPGEPTVARLVVPYSVAAMVAILCGQIAIVFIWRLCKFVIDGTIFTRNTSMHTNGIIICAAVATLLAAIVTVVQLVVPDSGYFVSLFLTSAATIFGLTLMLLMVVMRGLLNSAVAYRGGLDQVI